MKKALILLLPAILLAALFLLPAYAEEAPVLETYEDAVLYVRQQLKDRNGSFSYIYAGEEPLDLEDVLAYEGSAPDGGDYLRWNVGAFTEKDYADGECEFLVSYSTTAEEELAVNNAVAGILAEITADTAPEALSDYRKALLIYDWVCDHVTYSENGSGSAAYHALAEKKARCEGYALAYYRLARELGLDCRILTGLLSTDASVLSHAWNAVKIGNSWYYLDSTHGAWDDEGSEDGDRYAFFMMPAAWEGAQYTAEYTDGSTYLKTPAQIAEYTYNEPVFGCCDTGCGWVLDPAAGQLTLTGDGVSGAAHWTDYAEKVRSITAAEDADAICAACLTFSGLPLHCEEASPLRESALAAGIPCHTPAAAPEISPTCKSTGLSAGTVCGVCETYLTGGRLLPATDGHTDDGTGKCSVCGIAIDCIQHGFCGGDIRWYLSDPGKLTLTGTGEMKNYVSKSAPWYPLRESVRTVALEAGITSVGDYAFSGISRMQSVTLPATIGVIGKYAFASSINLREIELPSATHIMHHAFYNCSYLAQITLPPNIEALGYNAFEGTKIKYIYIPDSLTSTYPITEGSHITTTGPFRNSALETIEFAPGTTAVPDYCCAFAQKLKTVILPDSVTEIGNYAFDACIALTEVGIPPQTTIIGNSAYGGCTHIEYAFIPKTVTSMINAFSSSSVKKIEFENGIETIPVYACAGAKKLTEVVIPDSVTTIRSYAFLRCAALAEISLPGHLAVIEQSAFSQTENLLSVEIPASVREMGKAFSNSSVRSMRFAEGMETLPKQACAFARQLTEVTIPDTVTELEKNVFANCTSLTHVSLPEAITKIPRAIFEDSGLVSVCIPKNVDSIGDFAFSDCAGLTFVYVPASVHQIGPRAFENTASLSVVYLAPQSVEIASDAFRDTSGAVVFHCPADSDAAAYADAHGIACHTDLDFTSDIYGTLCTGEAVPDYVCFCRECGKIITESGLIDENGHRPITDPSVAPTCTLDGKTEGSHCAVCGTVFTAQEVIPAAGHRDVLIGGEAEDGVCDVCGARLWEPATPEGPEPEPEKKPLRIVQWFTSLYEGLAKALSNLLKLFSKMFGK